MTTWANEFGIALALDPQGHEHKGKGTPEGGQFTGPGRGDGGAGKEKEKAPDGKKPERTPEQATKEYKELGTRAPAFKAWFGKS